MKSLIAKRMMPSFDPTTIRGTYEYPGYDVQAISLARCTEELPHDFHPIRDWSSYYIVADGYFASQKGILLEASTIWLPDAYGNCKITNSPAPYNKTLGYIHFKDGYIDRSRLDEDYYILGLNKPLKVTFDYLRRTK